MSSSDQMPGPQPVWTRGRTTHNSLRLGGLCQMHRIAAGGGGDGKRLALSAELYRSHSPRQLPACRSTRFAGAARPSLGSEEQVEVVRRLPAKVFKVGQVPAGGTFRGPPPPLQYPNTLHVTVSSEKNITTFTIASTESPSIPSS